MVRRYSITEHILPISSMPPKRRFPIEICGHIRRREQSHSLQEVMIVSVCFMCPGNLYFLLAAAILARSSTVEGDHQKFPGKAPVRNSLRNRGRMIFRMECTDEGLSPNRHGSPAPKRKIRELVHGCWFNKRKEGRGGGTKKPRVDRGFAYAFQVIREWVLKFTSSV